MPGPPPKHPSKRRRRNAAPETTKLPGAGRSGRAPALGITGTLKATKEWWATIWASPMAAAWLDADLGALRRLAQIVDTIHRGVATGEQMSEARQLEDRFGLSPLARRRLQWEIEQDTDENGDAEEKPARRTRGDKRWLQAV